jgi:Amt family ammonium transporter
LTVHVCGGWAALAGAVIVGPRLARYEGDEPRDLPAANAGLVAMGGALAWIALMGLGASALGSLARAEDGVAIATILINSHLAAAGGVVVAIILTEIIYKRADLVILVNAGIAALIAISAGPISPTTWQAVIIGAFSGAIVTVTRPLLDRLRIDDAVGALPTHLLCGIWGVLIVPWSNEEATYLGQLAGIVIVSAFSLTMSILLWTVLRYTVGVRVAADREIAGLDMRAAAAPKPKL